MLALSATLLIFSFQFSLLSSIYRLPRQAVLALWHTIGFKTQYRTSDVAKNLGRYLSCVEHTAQGKD